MQDGELGRLRRDALARFRFHRNKGSISTKREKVRLREDPRVASVDFRDLSSRCVAGWASDPRRYHAGKDRRSDIIPDLYNERTNWSS